MADDLYERGLKVRKEVLGAQYVQQALDAADDFNRPFQEMITAFCWGATWGRELLPRKTRSMLNLAMLTALNRPHELKTHIRAALTNGCTKEEIREVLMQATAYAGVPAGVDAFRVATQLFAELEPARA
jgi:4-carboxymuconolactone decarboxylase